MSVDEIQFGFMPERGTIDDVSSIVSCILRIMKEEYHAKGKKFCMYFVDPEKAFDIVSRSVGIGNEEKRNARSFG